MRRGRLFAGLECWWRGHAWEVFESECGREGAAWVARCPRCGAKWVDSLAWAERAPPK